MLFMLYCHTNVQTIEISMCRKTTNCYKECNINKTIKKNTQFLKEQKT